LSIKERSPIEFKSPPDPSRQVEEVDEERKFPDGSLSVEKMEAGKYENRKIGTHPILFGMVIVAEPSRSNPHNW
jgi:hypothetical protein